MPYEVEARTVPERQLAAVRFHVSQPAEVAEKIGSAFGVVEAYLASEGIAVEGPAVAWYEPAAAGFDVTAGFMVAEPVPGTDDVVPATLPECEVAVVTHVGSYESLPEAYEAVHAWMAEHSRKSAWGNTMWEEYWSSPSTPPEQTRTVIFWPVEPASG